MNDREEAIFTRARETSSPEQRARYLSHACGDDRQFRNRMEALLAADDCPVTFLNGPVAALTTVDTPPIAEQVGTTIGPYKLLEQIGDGGMGVVYMAEQTAAGPPDGRPQDHQAGDGHPGGYRPFRGGAPGAGADGSSPHRQDPRCRERPRRAGPTS